MPIKPENKARYPKNWKEISEYIRFERAKNRCEICGVKNYSRGYWIDNKFRTVLFIINYMDRTGIDLTENISSEKKPIKIILTVAHLDHIPENCDPTNLKAMCQRCHNRYDIQHRKQSIRHSHNVGQLSLF